MKQEITIEQFMELSPEHKGKLWDWSQAGGRFYLVTSKDKQSIYPLLSIGQMIEFIMENSPYPYFTEHYERFSIKWNADEGICDALWEIIKEILKDKEKKI